jgi:hypothetical protein
MAGPTHAVVRYKLNQIHTTTVVVDISLMRSTHGKAEEEVVEA